MSDRDGDIEIYAMDANGAHPRRLTFAAGRDAHPSWSADGTKIYFQSPRSTEQPQIYVMKADGSNQVRLTQNEGFSGVPVCSPDGRQTLFQVNESPSLDASHWQIYVMDADGSRQRRLSNFYADRSGKDQLYVMNSDGSHAAQVSRNPSMIMQPSGRTIRSTSRSHRIEPGRGKSTA